MKALGCTGLLLALSSIVAADSSVPQSPCHARAWVRAPDLEPGHIIQGDVKVRLDGACTDVSGYSVGLRFAERSWVKTRREGVVLPERPLANQSLPHFSNASVFEPASLDFRFLTQGVEPSVWEKYQNDLKDPSLWLVREEERVAFETRFVLREGDQLSRELIEPFAILVPFTNYPPASDPSLIGLSLEEAADSTDSEHIYAYFVDINFANGTRREIPAGYTSFVADIRPQPPVLETIKVLAIRSSKCEKGRDCPTESFATTPQDEFTLEVTFPTGRHVAQGSANNISLISHQIGPGLQCPLALESLRTVVKRRHHWAAGFAVDNKTAEALLTSRPAPLRQLMPLVDDEIFYRRQIHEWINRLESPRFSQKRDVQNGTKYSTEAIIAPFKVPQDCYPHVAMYYQTPEVSLEITLEVRNTSSSTKISTPEEEEYDWSPKKEATESLRATIPLFVHPRLKYDTRPVVRVPTHYLSPEARAPIFVNPSSIGELQAKTADERDELAPIAQPKITTSDEGNIVKYRYYTPHSQRMLGLPPYYVGDVWLRKVLARRSSDDVPVEPIGLVVQG